MRAFMRFFEFAALIWVPIFFLIYYINRWKWSVAKAATWFVVTGLAAAALTAGVITAIVMFD